MHLYSLTTKATLQSTMAWTCVHVRGACLEGEMGISCIQLRH